MRSEDIDYLVRNNIPVTKYNLDNIDLFSSSRTSLRSDIDMGAVPLDIPGINSIYDYTASMFSEGIDNKIGVRSLVDTLESDVNMRISNINRALDELRNEVAASVVLEKSMSGQAETLMITFQDKSIVSSESDGVLVREKRVYADTSGNKSEKSAIRIEKYPFSSLSATMRSKKSLQQAKIEGVAASGVGYIPQQDDPVINEELPFRIESIADAETDVRLDLIIDREDASLYNQVELDLEVAHLVTIYTSNDGEEYTTHVGKPKYVYNSFIQIAPTTDRFLKVVFHKQNPDIIKNGNDTYLVSIKSLSLVRTTFTGQSTFISSSIEVGGAFGKIALNVCDATTYGHDALIKYYLSVNGQQWQAIRPIDRSTGDDITKSSVIDVNSMVDNRFMILDKSVTTNTITEYDLLLPEDFIRSNQLRIFGKNISDTPEEWDYERGLYRIVGILYTEKEIDFGTEEVSLNGKWTSGKVTLVPDIYRIEVKAENYANVILDRSGTVTDLGGGEFAVESSTGLVRTVFDPVYPYNHKSIIETSFDYIFKKELIENDDYNIYNKDSGYQVSTYEDNGTLLAAYRLYESNVNSIQIKAELQSVDYVTIPFIEKIIIRLA